MNNKKAEAYKLRVQGHSYNEISRELGIPKSTFSGWFRNLILNQNARDRLRARSTLGTEHLITINKAQTPKARKRAQEVQASAKASFPSLTDRDLLMIGVALYWAEGYKRKQIRYGRELTAHPLRFLNSDPEMVKLYVIFLRNILKVPIISIHLSMRLYKHINEEEARSFWQKATNLPVENFKSSSFLVSKASSGKRPFNRLPYGTLEISVNNTELFYKVIGLIEGMKTSLPYDRMSPLPG